MPNPDPNPRKQFGGLWEAMKRLSQEGCLVTCSMQPPPGTSVASEEATSLGLLMMHGIVYLSADPHHLIATVWVVGHLESLTATMYDMPPCPRVQIDIKLGVCRAAGL